MIQEKQEQANLFVPPKLHVLDMRFEARAEAEGHLPLFLGPALRGAVMAALRQQVCVFGYDDCAGCSLLDTCAYSYLFETKFPADSDASPGQDAPRPLIFEAAARRSHNWRQGGRLRFTVRLIGRAIGHAPVLERAVVAALRNGLGRDRIPFAVSDSSDQQVGKGGSPGAVALFERASEVAPGPISGPSRVTVRFRSPVRIQSEGQVLSTLGFWPFARSLVQRIDDLAWVHEGANRSLLARKLEDLLPGKVDTQDSSLRRVRVQRWSSRQARAIWLDGLEGEVTWEGQAVSSLYPYLKVGEFLHVGKGTVFGLGRYEIVSKPSSGEKQSGREKRA